MNSDGVSLKPRVEQVGVGKKGNTLWLRKDKKIGPKRRGMNIVGGVRGLTIMNLERGNQAKGGFFEKDWILVKRCAFSAFSTMIKMILLEIKIYQ